MQRGQRRLLARALAAGIGLAALAGAGALAPPASAQPNPQQPLEEREYRSNRPYGTDPGDPDAERRKEREARRGTRRPYEPDIKSGAESGHETAADLDTFDRPREGDSPWTVGGAVDFRDQYFFRGYNYTSSGLTVQPSIDVGLTVYERGDFSITPHGGGWFSFTEETGDDDPEHWSEMDLFAGAAVRCGDLTFDFQYVFYTSPNQTFEDIEEVGVEVSYDDSGLWGRRGPIAALNPSFAYFHEFEDENDDESNPYLGFGLEPELRPGKVGPLDVTVSFPMVLGGSYDSYYRDDDGHNEVLGYYTVGVKLVTPLPRFSSYASNWSLEFQVDYVGLIADNLEAGNGDDGDDITLRVGLGFGL